MQKPAGSRSDIEAGEEKLKHEAYMKYNAKIERWKGMVQKNNIKVLLCSLHDVIWQGSGWKVVGMHEFQEGEAAKLKKLYRKAILLTHPDRNQTQGADRKFLANAIFGALNEAWSTYENGQ